MEVTIRIPDEYKLGDGTIVKPTGEYRIPKYHEYFYNNVTKEMRYVRSGGYAKSLKAFIYKQEHWRADEGEPYWYIEFGNYFTTLASYDIRTQIHDKRYAQFNYFKTIDEAEEAVKKVKELLKEIHND